MALNQRNTTRWERVVGTRVASVIRLIGDVLGSFLGFKKGDNLSTKGKKTAGLAIRRIAYFIADYYLVALSAALVGVMKYQNFAFVWIVLAMWVFDAVTAGAFIAYYHKTGNDLSLGEDLRRATDTIHTKSRIAGYLATAGVILLAIVWTGPERIVIYFRKEIGTLSRAVIALLVLTAVQAVIWTVIYGLGYDLASQAF